jgi:RNA polymerase sigma factor for flagellar operon FliA
MMNAANREELIERHQGLVRSIASKIAAIAQTNIDFEDLLAYGQQGLVQATQRYDPDRGVAFATFAYYRIRGAIFDGIREMGPLIRIGKSVAYQEHADQYIRQRANEPAPKTAADAAQRLSGMVADLAVAYIVEHTSLESHPDQDIPDALDVAEAREGAAVVRERIAQLPNNERKLIELMYFAGLPLTKAALELGMSKGWASRLHTRAISRLREASQSSPDMPRTGPSRGKIRV